MKVEIALDDGYIVSLPAKPLIGGVFGRKQWCLISDVSFVGPTASVRYAVVDADSGMAITEWKETKGAALERARFVVSTLSSCYIEGLLRPYREALLAARISISASAAETSRRETERLRLVPLVIRNKRRAVFEAAGRKCHYCDEPLAYSGPWHIEHKKPKAHGGTNDTENLTASCRPCNVAKRTMGYEEFLALMARR